MRIFGISICLLVGFFLVAFQSENSNNDLVVATTKVAFTPAPDYDPLNLGVPDWSSCTVCHDNEEVVSEMDIYYGVHMNPVAPPPKFGPTGPGGQQPGGGPPYTYPTDDGGSIIVVPVGPTVIIEYEPDN